VLHFFGFILLIIGGVMLAPVPVAFLANETYLLPYFTVPAAIAIALGFFIRRRFQPTELSMGKAMVLVTFAWIIFAAFGSIPYIFGNNMPIEDAYFESMSGFTATGLTMILNVEGVAPTILFWRSLTQWVGGMGVIVLFLAALIGVGRAARKMYVAEARAERIEPSIRETARSLWKIYVLFTLFGIVGLYFAGAPNMSLFEAVNHSMAAIATGGFSVHNMSFAGYGFPVLAIAILLMMAGAISFVVHRRVMAGHWRELFRNIEVRLMLVLILLATLLLIWSVGLQDALFQSAAALTGTGFSTTDISGWGDPQKGLLTILMVIGGGYGSTSSAIKLIRTVIIVGAVFWIIKRSFLPQRAVVPMKISGRIYSDQEIMETAIYAFIYVIVLIGGAVVLMMLGNPAMDSLFESASAQGNVGLSVGITEAGMPLAGKISLTIQMLVGRLEIIPVIAFFSYLIGRVPRPRRKPF
jgi:trk system potassium uptake protein TrkH